MLAMPEEFDIYDLLGDGKVLSVQEHFSHGLLKEINYEEVVFPASSAHRQCSKGSPGRTVIVKELEQTQELGAATEAVLELVFLSAASADTTILPEAHKAGIVEAVEVASADTDTNVVGIVAVGITAEGGRSRAGGDSRNKLVESAYSGDPTCTAFHVVCEEEA